MSDILSKYLQQYEEDKLNEDYNLPEQSAAPMSESDSENYKKALDELRRGIDPNAYMRKMYEITYSEKDFAEKDCVKASRVTETRIIRAYCPKCGKELTTDFPPMYNPYTGEKQCIHKCECGEQYNLEYCYPRVAYFVDGEEISAFGR